MYWIDLFALWLGRSIMAFGVLAVFALLAENGLDKILRRFQMYSTLLAAIRLVSNAKHHEKVQREVARMRAQRRKSSGASIRWFDAEGEEVPCPDEPKDRA